MCSANFRRSTDGYTLAQCLMSKTLFDGTHDSVVNLSPWLSSLTFGVHNLDHLYHNYATSPAQYYDHISVLIFQTSSPTYSPLERSTLRLSNTQELFYSSPPFSQPYL